VRAAERFTEQCRQRLKAEIEDAGGNEVLALGYLDEAGMVARIVVSARGKDDRVLALLGNEDEPDLFIHNHPSGFLSPSDNDLAVSGRAAEGGIGAFIVDNPVEKVYVVAEPLRRKGRKALDPEGIAAALEEGGDIARRLPAFEARPSQLGMMRMVIRAFNEDAIAACEAGTGVGKSFAYLLPAIGYALLNDERIVVSTATITLQQQLFDKDIPLVAGVMGGKEGKKIKALLMKGRGNYLCRRRLEDALREPGLDEAENEDTDRIAAWAETSKTGSRSDLAFMPRESAWSRVCSEADLCMGMRCPERERCFVLALRREAADARILVVNHHLLFADLAARQEGAGYDSTVVLPPYSRVIVDEAHTVEGAATSFFSKEFSRPGIFRQLGRLYRRRGARRGGLLLRVAGLARMEDKPDEGAALIERIRETAETLDAAALDLCGGEGRGAASDPGGKFRLTEARSGAAEPLFPLFVSLRKQIGSLGNIVREMLEELPEDCADDPGVWEIKTILRRLENSGAICSAFVEFRERPGEVMWIERRAGGENRREPWAAFTVSPVNVAPGLKESLFDPNKTVVCCSATLTVGGPGNDEDGEPAGAGRAAAFAYWSGQCGLNLVKNRSVLTGFFPSPFPYAESVLLGAPRDAPLPEDPRYQAFVEKAVTGLTLSAGGSALVLFTSYQSLRSAWAAASAELEKAGIRCLKQGDADRSRLLKDFLEDQRSALFATDSFWEGVDAPGDTLRLVILCRLPFRSPNDPVFEARRENLERQGGSPFMELSLPEAVMKFKQGFGRLIRRSSDRGVVAVLDGRLLRKRYGEIFLRSLPRTRTSFGDFRSLLRDTEAFLF
jgi:ATP-dependent DNA helicase DinG